MGDEIDIEEALVRAVAEKDFVSACNLQSTLNFATIDGAEEHLKLTSLSSMQLSSSQRKQLFSILENNVERYYSSSPWGWNEETKRKELFHTHAKFLVLEDANSTLAGFIMFRFEWDDEDEPEHPVLYVYELQIADSYRGLGLGRKLMEHMSVIQSHYQMWKIMLTSFKANQDAMSFYNKIGYGIDVNSPSRCGFEDECYEILSNHPNRK